VSTSVDYNTWINRKRAFLRRLERDLVTGYFDMELYTLIKLLNSFDDMFTLSSCSGRLMLFSSKRPWDRKSIKIYLKKHNKACVSEVIKTLEESKDKNLWFVLQPPILHVSCLTVDRAQELLKLARNVGFKHSGIISFARTGIVVELRGNEHLEVPLKLKGKLICRKTRLKTLVKWANRMLIESKKKIFKLESEIKRNWLERKR